jgi:hypothetical protein
MATRGAITDARALSRAAGIGRLEAEARALGIDIPRAAQHFEVARDFLRGRLFGTTYAKAWLAKAKGSSTAEAAKAASGATAGSLRRTAVTESSEAFTSGRTAQAKQLPLGLLKVWDATLDKRTCPVCDRADGTIVGIRESFPDGEPGGVHAFCRCTWSVLSSSDDDKGTLIQPAPVQPIRLLPAPVLPVRPPIVSVATRARVDPLLAPLPSKAAAAQRVVAGIAERDLKFLRTGYRPKLHIYERVPLADVDAVATGRLVPPGSSAPVPPITISVRPDRPGEHIIVLTDGRHRLEAAQDAGATRIRSELVVYNRRGSVKWKGIRDIPIPSRDLTNRRAR